MATADAVAELAELLAGKPLVEVVGETQLIVDFLRRGAKALPKGTSETVKLAVRLFEKTLSREDKAAIIQADLVVARQKVENQATLIEARSEARIAERGATIAGQKELIGAKAEAKRAAQLFEAEVLPGAKARGTLAAEAVTAGAVVSPGIQDTARLEAGKLRARIRATRTPLPLADEMRKSRDIIELDPALKPDSTLLQLEADRRVADAQKKTLRLIDGPPGKKTAFPALARDPNAREIILQSVAETGQPATATTLGSFNKRAVLRDTQLKQLAEGGIRLSDPAGVIPLKQSDFVEKGGLITGKAGLSKAEPILQAAEKARLEGRLAESKSLLGRAIQGIKGGRLGRAGIAGLIGIPLLASLFRGRKDTEGQIPPALQIQLLRQMAEAQQQQQLTQSLVGSRGASAERDLARANLLRLQALSAAGGPAPAVV